MSIPEFSMSLGGSTVLFLIAFCAAIALTVFFYRTTTPPLSPRKKLLLAALRGFALALLLFLVFEPLAKFIFRQNQKPVLAVLIDDSESMTMKDRRGDRAAQARSSLGSHPLSGVPAEIHYYRFATQLQDAPRFTVDSLTFKGENTDLAAALSQLKEMRGKENIQAAVLLSDGNYTIGKNPLSTAEDLGIPLFTVGVGDTVEQRDVLIASVTTNKIVYAETKVPVDVRVRSSGFAGEKVEVTLGQGSTVLDRKVINLQEGTGEYSISLGYVPKEEGVQKYRVIVSTLPGELTQRNNTASFFVKVLKTKLRILLIAGAPSPDLSAVRQILSEEQHFTLKTLIQKAAGQFYEGTLTPAIIDSSDCLVLLGYPSSAASPAHIQLIIDATTRLKKPFVFVGSKTLDFEKLKTIETILPFSWTSPGTAETFVFPSIPEHQRFHVLIQLSEEVTADGWNRLPPIYKTHTIFRAKPEADVLATARPERGPVGFNEPLVLIRNIARQKSFAITGHGIWRWRLLAQGNPQTEKFLSLLLTNAVRWLTTLDEGKNVRVTPTKDAFTTSEPVEFTGEVYDEQFRPLENVELRLELTVRNGSPGQRFETLLQSIGSGRYEGSMEGLGPGDYSFTATATRDGKRLGEDKGKFSIGEVNAEFLETKMNKQLLEQLAYHTGGAYVDLFQIGSLVDTIRSRTVFSSKELTHASEVELWNWHYLGTLIVLMLATEWFVRKKSGLL